MSEFKPNTQNDNIFTVKFSEIKERLDSEFYKENFDFSEFIKLKQIAKVKGGKRIPKGYYYSNAETSFIYLRVSDLNSNDEINWNKARYIEENVFNILERYETIEGDLVFSIAGSIGKINVVKNIPEGKRVILTENASKIHFRKDIQVIPEFIELVLKTNFLKKQINLNYVQTTIPKIGLDRIEKLFIPKLVSLDDQTVILKSYNFFYNLKQQKINEAQELIESIDEYLLGELGITLPEKNNSLENRIFTTTLNQLSGGRFDPFYNDNFYSSFITQLEKHPTFGSLIKVITKGETPLWRGDSYVEEGVPFLQVNNLSIDGVDNNYKRIPLEVHNRMKRSILKGGEVLYSMAGTIGIATINNIDEEANINQAIAKITLINKTKINKSFLIEILNSAIGKLQAERFLTVSSQPNINFSQIKSIRIPLFSLEKQTEIANYITVIRNRAKQLELDAEQIMIDANAEVEKIILG
jgi:type I restriction enzyme S subunit